MGFCLRAPPCATRFESLRRLRQLTTGVGGRSSGTVRRWRSARRPPYASCCRIGGKNQAVRVVVIEHPPPSMRSGGGGGSRPHDVLVVAELLDGGLRRRSCRPTWSDPAPWWRVGVDPDLPDLRPGHGRCGPRWPDPRSSVVRPSRPPGTPVLGRPAPGRRTRPAPGRVRRGFHGRLGCRRPGPGSRSPRIRGMAVSGAGRSRGSGAGEGGAPSVHPFVLVVRRVDSEDSAWRRGSAGPSRRSVSVAPIRPLASAGDQGPGRSGSSPGATERGCGAGSSRQPRAPVAGAADRASRSSTIRRAMRAFV